MGGSVGAMAVDIGAMTADIGFCTGAGAAGFAASSFLLQAPKARVREKHNANEISFFIACSPLFFVCQSSAMRMVFTDTTIAE